MTSDFISALPFPVGEGRAFKNQLGGQKNIGWQTLNAVLQGRFFIKYFYVLLQLEPLDEAGLLLRLGNINETAACIKKTEAKAPAIK